LLQGQWPLRVRLDHRRGSARRLPGPGPPGGHHAGARIGSRRRLRRPARQDVAAYEGDCRGPVRAGRQGRPGRGQGAGPERAVSRLDATFTRLRARGERALVTYFTAGDPSLEATGRLVAEAERRGADVVELPPEEAAPLATEAARVGLDVIHLVAPTSTRDRLRVIARASRGFVYLVSITGVTGERADVGRGIEEQIRALRLVTTKPICVGFGIGRPEQVASIGKLADGVIVGSAIVRVVEEHASSPALVSKVGDFIAALKAPLRAPACGRRARRPARRRPSSPASAGWAAFRSWWPPSSSRISAAAWARPWARSSRGRSSSRSPSICPSSSCRRPGAPACRRASSR